MASSSHFSFSLSSSSIENLYEKIQIVWLRIFVCFRRESIDTSRILAFNSLCISYHSCGSAANPHQWTLRSFLCQISQNKVGMEQQGQGKQQLKGMVDSRVELLNNATYYQSNPVNVSTTTGVFNCFAPLQPSAQPSGFQLAHHLAYLEREQQSQQQLEQNLKAFWASQLEAAQWATDFKNHGVPLARIRKIMKADKDVAMISAEAPIIFARACEMFILELTLRSWHQTTQGNRRTLQKSDVKAAILKHDVLDFLHDVVARNLDVQEIGAQISDGRIPAMGPNDAIPYYHGMPLSNSAQVGTSAVNMPNFVLDPATYAQQPQLYAPQHMWQQESRSHP